MFSVQGPYPVIRAALWARGWVERRLPHMVQRPPRCHGDEEEDGDDGDVNADVTGEIRSLRERQSLLSVCVCVSLQSCTNKTSKIRGKIFLSFIQTCFFSARPRI